MPDEATLYAMGFIYSEPLIQAMITEHTHDNGEERWTSAAMQYITAFEPSGVAQKMAVA